MDVVKNDKWQYVDKDPATGIIMLGDTSGYEIDALMKTIINLGIPDDHVHTLYFKDIAVGIVKLEPCAELNSQGKKSSNLISRINKVVSQVHASGTYICLYAQYDTECSIDPDRKQVWFRSQFKGPDLYTTIEFHRIAVDAPLDLITMQLTEG